MEAKKDGQLTERGLKRLVERHTSRTRKEMVQRNESIEVLSCNECIDEHWRLVDTMLRTLDNKDSIFELEYLRKELIEGYTKDVVEPLNERCQWEQQARWTGLQRRKWMPEEAKQARKEYEQLMESVEEFVDDVDNLKRLYYAGIITDVYKRVNIKIRRQVEVLKSEQKRNLEKNLETIANLEQAIEESKRRRWCRDQVKRWEPERNPAFEGKPLAKDGGPLSPKSEDEQANPPCYIVRMVDSLQVESTDLDVLEGGHKSDKISREF